MKIFFGKYIIQGGEMYGIARIYVVDSSTGQVIFDKQSYDIKELKQEAIDFCSERL